MLKAKLLDMVSIDDKPEFEIGLEDSTRAWFQENSKEFILALILGFLLGIFISYVYCKISNFLKNQKQEGQDTDEHNENGRE